MPTITRQSPECTAVFDKIKFSLLLGIVDQKNGGAHFRKTYLIFYNTFLLNFLSSFLNRFDFVRFCGNWK